MAGEEGMSQAKEPTVMAAERIEGDLTSSRE
jgi:hypothetical protein